MQIINKKISDLIPYPLNNRKHPAIQVERLAASIKDFGFDQPIIIDKDNVIIAGHGRLAAAKQLKLDAVPCVVSTLDEVKARARRILDNKLQGDSEWDFEHLQLELDWLTESEFDVEFWGLDELFPETGKTDDDERQDEMSFKEPEFLVIITTQNELEQKKIYEELNEKGYSCKLIG